MRLRVLIVEDDPTSMETMRRNIVAWASVEGVPEAEILFVEAQSLNDALTKLSQGFDLVAVDIYLPRESLLESRVHTHGRDLIRAAASLDVPPTIYATSYGRADLDSPPDQLFTEQLAIGAGAHFYASKAADNEPVVLRSAIRQALGGPPPTAARTLPARYSVADDQVFLVHGRDVQSARYVQKLIQRMDVNVLDWQAAVESTESGTPWTLNVVMNAIASSKAIVVLFTPDELVSLRTAFAGGTASATETQSRPNVYIEAGAALLLSNTFEMCSTIFVVAEEVRTASDFDGVNYIAFDNASATFRNELASRLRTATFDIADSDAWKKYRKRN